MDVFNVIDNLKNDATGTISFWFKTDELKEGTMFEFSSTQNTSGFDIALRESGKISLYTGDGTVNHFYIWTDSTFAVNQWYHVAVTQNGSGVKLYVNGVEISTQNLYANNTVWFTHSNSATWNVSRIANYHRTDAPESFFFKGTIDDFRYYKRGLTVDEVEAIYNNGNGTENGEIIYTP